MKTFFESSDAGEYLILSFGQFLKARKTYSRNEFKNFLKTKEGAITKASYLYMNDKVARLRVFLLKMSCKYKTIEEFLMDYLFVGIKYQDLLVEVCLSMEDDGLRGNN